MERTKERFIFWKKDSSFGYGYGKFTACGKKEGFSGPQGSISTLKSLRFGAMT